MSRIGDWFAGRMTGYSPAQRAAEGDLSPAQEQQLAEIARTADAQAAMMAQELTGITGGPVTLIGLSGTHHATPREHGMDREAGS